jgi:hypothetical protein
MAFLPLRISRLLPIIFDYQIGINQETSSEKIGGIDGCVSSSSFSGV